VPDDDDEDEDEARGGGVGVGKRREREETVEQPPQWRSRSACSEWDAQSSCPSADGGVTFTAVASLSREHLRFVRGQKEGARARGHDALFASDYALILQGGGFQTEYRRGRARKCVPTSFYRGLKWW